MIRKFYQVIQSYPYNINDPVDFSVHLDIYCIICEVSTHIHLIGMPQKDEERDQYIISRNKDSS